MWEVEYTDEFETWWTDLTQDQQEALDARVMLLAEHGPGLKRPVVGVIETSRHSNMKELRVSRGGALRVLFAFDPRRHAILLLGGDKSGQWEAWYKWAIPLADDLYDAHLQSFETRDFSTKIETTDLNEPDRAPRRASANQELQQTARKGNCPARRCRATRRA